MEIKGIILVVIFIIVLFFLIRYLTTSKNNLSSLTSGTIMQQITASSLATNSTNSTNFSYSIWFNVNDWNYKYGQPKIIFGRMNTLSNAASTAQTNYEDGTTTSFDPSDATGPCPIVSLAPLENNLIVSLACFANMQNQTNEVKPFPNKNFIMHKCIVPNVPIQKWVNLLISVYGRTLDIYLDGKLVKTCPLPGVPKINQNAPIYITPLGGFSGWTSKLQYFANSTDPQTAWSIYKKGYANGLFSGSGNYQVNVSVTKNGTQTSEYTF